MIIVTGATGRLGRQVVEELLEHVPARPGRDFTGPATLDHAFEGADQLLLVSAAIRPAGRRARAAVDAAVRAGASRVLYTSHQAASPDSEFSPARQHAATEKYLAEQNIPYTALRHGFYTSTFEHYVPAALKTGQFRLPADGPVSWTAHADLVAADVAALTKPGLFDGATPPLTAPDLLDFADVADILSSLTGRATKRVVVADEEWKAAVVAQGMPEAAAEFTLGMFRAARAGEFAVTDPALEDLLGRPAIPVRTVLEDLLRSR
ncbi:NAD(P)-dependent oxidoreductase [Lentzea guizhouensis]|uniref:NAD(P)-dependent oxidoreductase n=1 Tax=Lentzea guizhouensis TaxID=1586287 RepID=A0A1B2HRJ0_9PSEU|nr:NAD(P)H-binding protein [Lentzea guizhouensis]ANZ40360.1 NAD(P)-dependent oxidoreductase [Lentzea guizhouensis]